MNIQRRATGFVVLCFTTGSVSVYSAAPQEGAGSQVVFNNNVEAHAGAHSASSSSASQKQSCKQKQDTKNSISLDDQAAIADTIKNDENAAVVATKAAGAGLILYFLWSIKRTLDSLQETFEDWTSSFN